MVCSSSAGHTVVAEASDRLEATNWMMEPPSPTTFLARNVGFVIADTNPEGHILAAQRGRVSVSCGTIGVAAVQ
jgi:hypothetical protein